MAEVYVGIDVSKEVLDVKVSSKEKLRRVKNTPEGIRKVVTELAKAAPTLIVVESTGGYELLLADALWAAGLPLAVVNPRLPKAFAKSLGFRAKTDSIDAEMLALYAERVAPAPTPAPKAAVRALRLLFTRRRQLSAMIGIEKTRRQGPGVTLEMRGLITEVIAHLSAQISEIDARAKSTIEADPELKEKFEFLLTIAAVGPVLAQAVVALLPELGTLNRKQVAALCGVAPYNNDSGTRSGPRHIAGGRSELRAVLYMGALTAIRMDKKLRALYRRLREAGKQHKVAMVACMRQLIIAINARYREHCAGKKPSGTA